MKKTRQLSIKESLELVDRVYCEAIADKLLEKEALKDLWNIQISLALVEDEYDDCQVS